MILSKPALKGTHDVVKYCYYYNPFEGKLFVKGKNWDRQAGSNSGPYFSVLINGEKLKASAVCWYLYFGEWPSDKIVHVNGHKFDIRINNLYLQEEFCKLDSQERTGLINDQKALRTDGRKNFLMPRESKGG